VNAVTAVRAWNAEEEGTTREQNPITLATLLKDIFSFGME
jgi:hypothetical protein